MANECKVLSDLPQVAKLNGEFRKDSRSLPVSALHQRRSWAILVMDGISFGSLLDRPGVAWQVGDTSVSRQGDSLSKKIIAGWKCMGALLLRPIQYERPASYD